MEEVLSGVKTLYLIGIGGIGMSGLALLLKDKGFSVNGSDLRESHVTQMLRKEGIVVRIGHEAKNITPDIDIVCYSSAINEDNPELKQAKMMDINVIKRGALLARLCRNAKTIAVAGSHGKTTTTSLLGYLLMSLGYKPTVFVGGLPLNYSRGAWWGDDYFLIETDESDASFLCYEPWVSLITNIDYEHLDHYKTMENLRESFARFAYQTKNKVFGWGDDAIVSDIIKETKGISFGWGRSNQVRGVCFRFEGSYSCFDLYIKGNFITRIESPLVGEYNCLNVLAAFAFCDFLGEDWRLVKAALKDFKGTKRRFQIQACVAGVTFVDDYAHHPTEIEAVIGAARLLKHKRIIVVLQPHRFSRVNMLKNKFSRCLWGCYEVIVTDIYSAHEDNPSAINSLDLYDEISKNFSGKARYIPKNKLVETIPSSFRDGDLVLALGAGDINTVMQNVIYEFKKDIITTQH